MKQTKTQQTNSERGRKNAKNTLKYHSILHYSQRGREREKRRKEEKSKEKGKLDTCIDREIENIDIENEKGEERIKFR